VAWLDFRLLFGKLCVPVAGGDWVVSICDRDGDVVGFVLNDKSDSPICCESQLHTSCAQKTIYLLRGKSVRFTGPELVPQGGVLSS
jgi:hypothetical protein